MFGRETQDHRRIRVKVCGITNEADALAAIECGADALGFNFFPGSKRYLDVKSSADWISKLPDGITKVAVLVNPTWTAAINLAKERFIDALQLHGNEPPAFCQRLAESGVTFAKALPVSDRKSLIEIPDFFTSTLILDSVSSRGFGGTGEVFPWALGQGFVKSHPTLRVILAGGLTAENVARAVQEVRPFGVDVTSGVEASPGRKSRRRLHAFIQAARAI
jgi:phosphoribosylanthranilate isomerase